MGTTKLDGTNYQNERCPVHLSFRKDIEFNLNFAISLTTDMFNFKNELFIDFKITSQ